MGRGMTIRNIIVHAHIFKNAGSTFDWTLKRNFGDGFVDHREDAQMINGKMNYLRRYLEDHPRVVALGSHRIHFHIRNTGGLRFFPVYFLRDPIDRARSVYLFEKKQTGVDTQGSRMAKQLTFKEFMAWYLRPDAPATVRNAQTIYCSGTGLGERPDSIRHALELVESNSLIGLVDRYDESMVLFEEILREAFPELDLAYVMRNVSQKSGQAAAKDKRAEILEELGEVGDELIERNRHDLLIYKRAGELLDKRLGAVVDLERKLDEFRKRCQKLAGAKAESVIVAPAKSE